MDETNLETDNINQKTIDLDLPGEPRIISRDGHSISRKMIDPDALKVMYRLINAGHRAFLVGGAVRDILLGKSPKDFDVSTSASPEQIRRLFRNSRIIGRRFRLVHVYFYGRKVIEVSTFRRSGEVEEVSEEEINEEQDTLEQETLEQVTLEEGCLVEDEVENQEEVVIPENGILLSDNTYGDAQTDAFRRDLTINAIFYDPQTFQIIDYVGGFADLESKIIRVIGDPLVRYREDPVRMIRVLRHAARTGFQIEQSALDAISSSKDLISNCSRARVFEELQREFRGGYAEKAFELLNSSGLLQILIPQLSCPDENSKRFLKLMLQRLDRKKELGRELSVPVVFLTLFIDHFVSDSGDERTFFREKITELFSPIGVSRRHREEMEDIIIVAHLMFRDSENGKVERSPAIQRRCFKDALLLLQLTMNNASGKQCFESWVSRWKTESANRKRSPQSRHDNRSNNSNRGSAHRGQNNRGQGQRWHRR